MAPARLLLVDDDETVRNGLQGILEAYEFDVTVAANVPEALQRIASQSFDVLLSDLHMPGAGDGLTVVSAMRHAHPQAVTIVLSANPDMAKAAAAILEQADEVVLKPVKVASIVELIEQRLAGDVTGKRSRGVVAVAEILEHESEAIREAWVAHLESEGSLAIGRTTVQERCEHLPAALRDVIFRLRYPQPLGGMALFSMAALQHGARRRRQGLGAASIVEEARALQVAIFAAVERNMHQIDLGRLPATLMAIADEVNAQLHQSLAGYENEQPADGGWGGGFTG